MSTALVLLVLLVAAAAIYDFANGFQDSANVVATMIASRAMSARGALLLAAAGTLAGPFVIGVAVARTVGSEVLAPDAITVAVAMAALLAATMWNLSAWYFSVPVSSSHALVGGLLGAGLHGGGTAAVQEAGIVKIAVSRRCSASSWRSASCSSPCGRCAGPRRTPTSPCCGRRS